ncbi:MAG: heterodisulfide reductase-related iron-sulfur binding cluster [Promethearchaeota archaeon]
MDQSKRISGFKAESCNECGECLHQCPVLQIPMDKAKSEIRDLIELKGSKKVLANCNTCFSCNLYCPTQANPYQLILENWNQLYKFRGAPPLYKFVCPTEVPNIWQLLNIFLSNREQRWIHEWMNYIPKQDDEVLLIGNYTHLFPFIIGGSKILDFFSPIDRIDQWEGGAYLYQGGYLDVVEKIAQKTKRDFDCWGVKNITATLDAVQYIFSEAHPNELGVIHEQTFKNLNNWLLDNMKSGKLLLEKKLDLVVTIHDNCYSKVHADVYWDPPREIIQKCGCKIKEMKHNKKDALCCGFGAGASWVKNMSIPFDIISEGTKKFKEAEKTGAKALITYCGGCYYLLWATRELTRSKMDVYHVIEVVRMAMGEKLNYPIDHVKRAWDIIAIITYQLLISMFQKNFFITNIMYDKNRSTFKPKRHLILKLLRHSFNIKSIRILYSRLFQILMPLLKTR